MPYDPTLGANRETALYDLQALARAKNPRARRKVVVLRAIIPTNAQASDLYQRAYKPLVTAMQAAIPGIVAAYERGLLVRDHLPDVRNMIRDSTDQAQQQTESLGQQLQRLVLTLLPGLSDWTIRTEKWHRDKWRAAVLTPTGVDVSTLLLATGTPTSVADTIAWNVALMKDVSQQAQTKMQSAIFAAFQRRAPARDLASDLNGIVDLGRKRALRISSDQLQKLSSALDRERAVEAGLSTYTWKHSHKLHPRPVHVARDGKVFRYDTPPDDGPPGSLPFCGCRALARLDF